MKLQGKFGWGEGEGKVWLFQSLPVLSKKTVESILPPAQQVKKAFAEIQDDLTRQKKSLKKGKEFLNFPLAVLADPQLWGVIQELLKKGASPSQAIKQAFFKWERELEKLDESYLRLRIQDLADLRQRLLMGLSGQQDDKIPTFPFIAVGKDLYVTELLRLYHTPLQGICIEEGNESAHGLMLAKSLGIPLIGKIAGLLKKCNEGDQAKLRDGVLFLNEDLKTSLSDKAGSQKRTRLSGSGFHGNKKGFFTKDKVPVMIRANLQLPEEIEKAKAAGAQGVGLFRTEFLWMRKEMSVQEEAQIYRQVLEVFIPDPVVFRLADFGSDKPYEKVEWPLETNPALGWRGLRFLLDHPELLNRQLEALCEAIQKETLHLILPMVRTLEEIEEFLKILKSFQKKHRTKVRLGIMVETPSSAYLLDSLPKEVQFVSLGTNDLLQYFFAVDRLHAKIKADSLHPAFLHFLEKIIQKAKRAKKSISLCGEMAGDERALPILLALGLREFSVSIPKIPEVADRLKKISVREAQKRIRKLLS